MPEIFDEISILVNNNIVKNVLSVYIVGITCEFNTKHLWNVNK